MGRWSLSLLGAVFAFLAGLVALKWLSNWLENGRWYWFGIYCLVASGVCGICTLDPPSLIRDGCSFTLPRVEGRDSGGGEIGGVASDDCHAVHQCGCGDDRIVFGTRVWNVQGCGSLGDLDIKREDAPVKGFKTC